MRHPSEEGEPVNYSTCGEVGVLTLNRPRRLNAISEGLRRQVHRLVEHARADDAVRALVITGTGRGFCSGSDLLTGPSMPRSAAEAKPARGQAELLDEMDWVGRWAKLFYDFDKPMVGAVNGIAAGAGMSMALSCDVRVGSPDARFKTVFVERNLSPDSGLSFFLPRIVGYAHAADLILTSREVAASEALDLGLLNRVVPAERLLEEAVGYAREMTRWPPVAIRSAKRVLQRSIDSSIDDALRYERIGLDVARSAVRDTEEARAAFFEKRDGVFTGT